MEYVQAAETPRGDRFSVVVAPPGSALDAGGHGVFVMNADGSGVREVTKPPLIPYFYAPWSPDGRLFAFAGDCGPPNQWNICVVNADGSGLRAVAPGPKVDTPAWSPDSTRLAFVRQNKDVGKWDLYTVGLDGSDERQVTDLTGIAASPSWSPDGGWIAFPIDRGANKQLFKVPSGEASLSRWRQAV